MSFSISAHQIISALELPQTKRFIKSMVDKHGFVQSELEYLFKHTQLIIKEKSVTKQPPKKYKPMTWTKYKSL